MCLSYFLPLLLIPHIRSSVAPQVPRSCERTNSIPTLTQKSGCAYWKTNEQILRNPLREEHVNRVKRVRKASLSSARARHWLSQRGKNESIRPACYAKGCWGDMWWGSMRWISTTLLWFQPKLFFSQSFPKSEIWMHVYVFTVSINSLYTVTNTNNEIKESSLDVLKETCEQNYGWTLFNGNPSPSCAVSNWSKNMVFKTVTESSHCGVWLLAKSKQTNFWG